MHDAAELQLALSRMEPRLAMVVERRFVDERSASDFGALYGLPAEQADRLVWRAVNALEASLAGRAAPPPLPDATERQAAAQLRAGLDTHPLVIALVQQRVEVASALARAREAYDTAPARTWETWARRLAIAGVLAWVLFGASRG